MTASCARRATARALVCVVAEKASKCGRPSEREELWTDREAVRGPAPSGIPDGHLEPLHGFLVLTEPSVRARDHIGDEYVREVRSRARRPRDGERPGERRSCLCVYARSSSVLPGLWSTQWREEPSAPMASATGDVFVSRCLRPCSPSCEIRLNYPLDGGEDPENSSAHRVHRMRPTFPRMAWPFLQRRCSELRTPKTLLRLARPVLWTPKTLLRLARPVLRTPKTLLRLARPVPRTRRLLLRLARPVLRTRRRLLRLAHPVLRTPPTVPGGPTEPGEAHPRGAAPRNRHPGAETSPSMRYPPGRLPGPNHLCGDGVRSRAQFVRSRSFIIS